MAKNQGQKQEIEKGADFEENQKPVVDFEKQIEELKRQLQEKDKEIQAVNKTAQAYIKHGFAVAIIDPTTKFHQDHWEKKSILNAVRVNMTNELDGKEDLIKVYFDKVYDAHAKDWVDRKTPMQFLPMNDHKKAFRRLFQWCANLDEALELVKSIK